MKVLDKLNNNYHNKKKKEIKTFLKNINWNPDNNSNSRPHHKFL